MTGEIGEAEVPVPNADEVTFDPVTGEISVLFDDDEMVMVDAVRVVVSVNGRVILVAPVLKGAVLKGAVEAVFHAEVSLHGVG